MYICIRLAAVGAGAGGLVTLLALRRETRLGDSLSIYICIYGCICICVCVYICTYIYIYAHTYTYIYILIYRRPRPRCTTRREERFCIGEREDGFDLASYIYR